MIMTGRRRFGSVIRMLTICDHFKPVKTNIDPCVLLKVNGVSFRSVTMLSIRNYEKLKLKYVA